MTDTEAATTDLELLRAWRAGDAVAGRELVRRHQACVRRMFVHKVGDAVDDLVQRTFLACLAHVDQMTDGARFRAYLLRTARNELYLHFRERHGPRGRIDAMTTSVHELAPSPSRELSELRRRDLLLFALQTLPLDLQLALELHYWEALRGPELAIVLGIPEGTVRSRLRLAKDRLRTTLARLGDAEPIASGDFDAWADGLRRRSVTP
jgi:RNA polymerase sigma factor (sigma-70 family)